jgi:PleD family two-component response regulator
MQSVGCAPQHCADAVAGLLRRADRALYQAKRMSRNRVGVASRLPTRA